MTYQTYQSLAFSFHLTPTSQITCKLSDFDSVYELTESFIDGTFDSTD